MDRYSIRARWVAAIGAIAILGLLFYGARPERPQAPPRPSPQALSGNAPPDAKLVREDAKASQTAAPSNLSKAAPTALVGPAFVDLVQAVKPAVVSIRVKADLAPRITSDGGSSPLEDTPLERFFRYFGTPGEPQQAPERHYYAQGQGSGFFISGDGYVVTNNHVVAKAVKLEVVTDDGRILQAKTVGTDPKTDLALVKVEGGQGKFPFVSFAEDAPKTGEWVIAMGNPFGLGGTVTAGIVSAQGRDIGSGPYDDFLQIDAAVNRGNSGGPTFDMSGRVIGINTAIFSPTGGSVGIAFSIPASIAKPVIAQLKERGYVERGWIGVQVQPVSKDIAGSLGMKETAGALIAATDPGGPAAKAGLRPGDVVTAVNGTRIGDSRDLARKIASMTPNTTAKLDYFRDGRTQTAEVTLGQLQDSTARAQPPAPSPSRHDEQASKLGLAVAPAARVMGIGEQGLAVLRVDPNGGAAEAGLAAGDVILKVAGREVSSPQELASALAQARAQRKEHVLALVRRGQRQMFVALPAAG
jgi:serine protease Do